MTDAATPSLDRWAAELRGERGAVVWPRASEDIPDHALEFRLVYLSPDWAGLDEAAFTERLDHLTRKWGRTRREFRNAIGFAAPDADGAYRSVRLPRMGPDACGPVDFVTIHVPSMPEAANGSAAGAPANHEAMTAALAPHFRDEIAPEELARLIGLGRVDCAGVTRRLFPLADVPRWFFTFLNLPRLRNVDPLRRAVAEGVARGVFGVSHDLGLPALDAQFEPEPVGGSAMTSGAAEALEFAPGTYLVDLAANGKNSGI